MTGRVAGIDCGTNSIRLLIADVEPSGRLRDVVRRMEIVRLGQGVDATGRIDDAAMARTLAMCREYAAACREHGVRAVRFVATSASRDASNAEEFIAGVEQAFADFGTRPEVVTGLAEASLSFRGATGDLVAAGAPAPFLVVDIGGGSTELVRGGADGVTEAVSVDIGCVRMTERHFRSDPPTPAQVQAAVTDIDAALDRAAEQVDLTGVGTLVGVAGSVTTLTAHALRLPSYQPEAIHGARLDIDTVLAAAEELLTMPRPARSGLPYLHAGRVDVIAAGSLVWARVLDRVRAASGIDSAVTSEHDILDGITLSVLGGHD